MMVWDRNFRVVTDFVTNVSHLYEHLGTLDDEKQPWQFISDITDTEVLLAVCDLK